MLLFKSFTILIIGFVLLIKGADFFVEGSSAVAKRLRIPSMIIGMTISKALSTMTNSAASTNAPRYGFMHEKILRRSRTEMVPLSRTKF